MQIPNTRKIKANALQARKSMVILESMVRKNIKNQYRRSFLGVLWTVLNPLLTMLVMAFVFSNIFGRQGISMDYPVYVLSGNIVFSFMRAATSNSLTCIVNNYDLLTKTRVPYAVFPISQTLSSVVNFGFSFIALIVVMLIRIPNGVTFHWTMFMTLVPWLPSIMMFTTGISFILCSVYVRFRDIKHIYSVFLTLWMYMTPIFYSLDVLKLDPVARQVMEINPMLHYLNYFRDIVCGTVPTWQAHAICYGAGAAALLVGWVIFRLSRKKFILYI